MTPQAEADAERSAELAQLAIAAGIARCFICDQRIDPNSTEATASISTALDPDPRMAHLACCQPGLVDDGDLSRGPGRPPGRP